MNPRLRLVPAAAVVVLAALAASPAAALVGGALRLDGARSFVEIAPGPDLHARGEVTVTGWFQADGDLASRGWQALFWKGTAPDRQPFANREIGLWLSASGRLQLCATPADSTAHAATILDAGNEPIQPGRWYHFATVVSAAADSMWLYLDGRPVARRDFAATALRAGDAALRLGGIPDRDYFHGLLDEVRLWDRRLSPDEIARDPHVPVGAAAPGLVAAWAFEGEDLPGTIADASGHGHAGRLQGQAHRVTLRALVPPVGVLPDSAALAALGREPAASVRVRPIHGELADLLIVALRSDDHRVRRRAAGALDDVALVDFPRVVRVALASSDWQVRSQAADALARVGADAPAETGVVDLVVGNPHVAWLESLGQRHAALGALDLPSPWNPEAYRGWEDRWLARRPAYWQLEPEGLVLRYNRVEGIYAGWRMPRTYERAGGLTHYGTAGYGLASGDVRYQAGGEVYTFYGPAVHASWTHDNLAALGGELHSLTDTQDGWLLPEEENSVDALLFRRDFRDYYERRGWSAYTAHNLGGVLHLTGRYQWDEFASLAQNAEWGLLGGRFGRAAFRPNPAIAAQQIRSLRADVQVDTRNDRGGPHRGWFANALFERAGGFLGGDARFKRYLADLRRYQPLGRGARADLRLRLGTAKGPLPLQYRYALGGYGSLRGYGFKEFSGDRMVLANAEYWVDTDRQWHADFPIDGAQLGVFFDGGAAWNAADGDDPFDGVGPLLQGDADGPDWHGSVGVALGLDEDLVIHAARPLGRDDWVFSLRFSRSL